MTDGATDMRPEMTSIIDLRVNDLIEIIRDTVVDVHKEEDRRPTTFTKDSKLGSLSVEQFSQLMVSLNETKGYLAAKKEQEVTERIFKDADGIIQAGIVPFRVNAASDVVQFMNTLTDYFRQGGRGTFVVAAALISDDGKYKGV